VFIKWRRLNPSAGITTETAHPAASPYRAAFTNSTHRLILSALVKKIPGLIKSERLNSTQIAVQEIPYSVEPQSSLPRSQHLATVGYPQPVQPNPVFNTVFLRSILTHSSQTGPQITSSHFYTANPFRIV